MWTSGGNKIAYSTLLWHFQLVAGLMGHRLLEVCVCVFVCKKGGVMVKIRTPAGAERQGDLCCIRAGPGRADRRHGEGGAVIQAQSLRNASRDSPAIPEAGAHLSGMCYSELLTTSSNWTIFSYLSGSQLHRLQRASVRTEKA